MTVVADCLHAEDPTRNDSQLNVVKSFVYSCFTGCSVKMAWPDALAMLMLTLPLA